MKTMLKKLGVGTVWLISTVLFALMGVAFGLFALVMAGAYLMGNYEYAWPTAVLVVAYGLPALISGSVPSLVGVGLSQRAAAKRTRRLAAA